MKLTFAILAFLATSTGALAGPAMDRITERKSFSVCTALDMKPFSYTDSGGQTHGFIIEIINNLHSALETKLGTKLELMLVPVIPANRIEFLSRGRCDATITSMNVTEERKKVIDFAEPGYFYSGANILAKKDVKIASWENMEGRKLCSLQGSIWNSEIERRFGADILAFGGVAEAEQAVWDGRCEGWMSDDGYLLSRLTEEVWANYELKLTAQEGSPWAAALAFGNEDLKSFIAEQIKFMHTSGAIIELAEKWNLPKNEYITQQYEK